MTGEGFAAVAEALAALIWPLLALLVAVEILPVLREIVRRRQFTIKIGSFELSAQEATDQVLVQIEDLQKKLIALEAARPSVGAPEAAGDFFPAPAGGHDPFIAPAPAPPTRASAPRRILWVDDKPENNAALIASLQGEGIEVETVRTGVQVMARLAARQARFAAVVTDLGRVEDGRYIADAATGLINAVRASGFDTPVAVYTNARAVRMGGDALTAGAELVTASPTELRAFVERHTGGADAD